MFTGLVEALGVVRRLEAVGPGKDLIVSEPRLAAELQTGDSVAVNGACLTVVAREGDSFRFNAGPETLRLTIDRNLWTAIWCCRAVLPHMKAAKYGRIVSIGADSVRNGLWDHAAYNAAKGGVHGLTSGLAREFAGDGITVNTVAPCAVATPQLEAFIGKGIALIEKFIGVIPMGRAGEMHEVASAVSYFASGEASFVTGQVVSVNGGSTML